MWGNPWALTIGAKKTFLRRALMLLLSVVVGFLLPAPSTASLQAFSINTLWWRSKTNDGPLATRNNVALKLKTRLSPFALRERAREKANKKHGWIFFETCFEYYFSQLIKLSSTFSVVVVSFVDRILHHGVQSNSVTNTKHDLSLLMSYHMHSDRWWMHQPCKSHQPGHRRGLGRM